MENDYGSVYAELYHRHWWWRSRERILLDEISRHALPDSRRILDFGCGDGLFFPSLESYGDVWGVEVDRQLVRPDNPYRHRILEKLPSAQNESEKYSLITALDVIEHIEDDVSIIAEITDLLEPGGHLVVTVPAFMMLWDEHDEVNHHFRRYTRAGLRALLAPHGEIRALRYLFHGIFLPKLMVRCWNLLRSQKAVQHSIPGPALSRFLESWCYTEARLCRRLPVPFGTSVLAVLVKEGSSREQP